MSTRTRFLTLIFLAVAASVGILLAQAQKKPAIAYPAYPNDPRHWRHVKTMVIYSRDSKLYDRFAGVHSVYVNDIGWPAFKNGKLFPDGSMLALELYGTLNGPGSIEAHGLKATFVMKKNAKAYADTGGWGFEVFSPAEQAPTLKSMNECWDCHKIGKSRDYVKSEYMQ